MAAKNCSGSGAAPAYCSVDWLRRRRELEDMPMTRLRAPRETAESCPCRGCGCPGEMAATLEDQTRLLYDILATVNALAATQLAQRD